MDEATKQIEEISYESVANDINCYLGNETVLKQTLLSDDEVALRCLKSD